MSKRKNVALARSLRRNQTEAESHLWQELCDRRLGGYKFRRQHPIGNYILDFYCPEKKLAIELDGDQHATIRKMIYDQERTTVLEKQGIKVLRYWNNEAMQCTDEILDDILLELEQC